ncbi:hypothetical protein AB8O64_24305 [Streptomyces sp. QH1-20]
MTDDLLKAEGLDAAEDGVEIVLRLAGSSRGDDEATGTSSGPRREPGRGT